MKQKREFQPTAYRLVIVILAIIGLVALVVAYDQNQSVINTRATLEAQQTEVSAMNTQSVAERTQVMETATQSAKIAEAEREQVMMTNTSVVQTQVVEQENSIMTATSIAETIEAERELNTQVENELSALQSRVLADVAMDLFTPQQDNQLALALAVEAASINQPSPLAQRVLVDIAYSAQPYRRLNTERDVYQVAYHPSGDWVAVGTSNDLLLWDLASNEAVSLEGHESLVQGLDFSDDGKWLASGDYGGKNLILWDVETQEILWQVTVKGEIQSLDISADGSQVVVGGGSSQGLGFVQVYNMTDGEMLWNFTGKTMLVFDVKFSPSGEYIMVGSSDQTGMYRINVTTHEMDQQYNTPRGTHTRHVEFSSDGERVAGGFAIERMMIYDTDSGETLHTLRTDGVGTDIVAFSFYENNILAVTSNGRVQLWDIESESIVQEFRLNGVLGTSDISSDGQLAISGGRADSGGVATVWDFTQYGETKRTVSDDDFYFNNAIFTPDGQYLLAYGSAENDHQEQVKLIQVSDGSIVYAVDISNDTTSIGKLYDVSKDGKYFLVGQSSVGLQLRETATGDLIYTHDESGRAMFIDDQTFLLTSGQDATVHQIETGEVIRQIQLSVSVRVLTISNGGQYYAGVLQERGTGNSTLIIFDATTFEEISRSPVDTRYTSSIVFSPDDTQILLTSSFGFEVWDWQANEQVVRRDNPDDIYYSVVSGMWHPSGDYVLFAGSSSGDGTEVGLWDIQQNERVRQYTDVGEGYSSLALTDDGRLLTAFSSASDTLGQRGTYHMTLTERLFHDNADLLEWVSEHRYVRDFTCDERLEYDINPLCEN